MVDARLAPYRERAATVIGETVGTLTQRLVRDYRAESSLGSFVADVMRQEYGAEVAIENAGGLRADLPGGAFTAHVLGLRLGWAFSTRLFARAYVQYNSLEDKWITNVRLNFIHPPGSDVYVLFNDDQGEEGAPARLVSRGFAVKGTWLLRF